MFCCCLKRENVQFTVYGYGIVEIEKKMFEVLRLVAQSEMRMKKYVTGMVVKKEIDRSTGAKVLRREKKSKKERKKRTFLSDYRKKKSKFEQTKNRRSSFFLKSVVICFG